MSENGTQETVNAVIVAPTPQLPSPVSQQKELPASIEIEVARAVAEVKAAVLTAHMVPRDELASRKRILQACSKPATALRARWNRPQSGNQISGPSIRLAEEIALNWGNFQYGVIEHGNRGGESQMEAYAWDLESNVRKAVRFSVPHYRYKNDVKEQSVSKNPQEIYEIVSGSAQRRVRDCILALIPDEVVEEALATADATKARLATDVGVMTRDAIAVFATELAVTQAELEQVVGKSATAWDGKDIEKLQDVFTTLREGAARLSDYLSVETSAETAMQNVQVAIADRTPATPAQPAAQATPPKLEPPKNKKGGAKNLASQQPASTSNSTTASASSTQASPAGNASTPDVQKSTSVGTSSADARPASQTGSASSSASPATPPNKPGVKLF